MIGVDEAGKGAVLGSMFVAAVQIDSSLGCLDRLRDSKQLGSKERKELAGLIRRDACFNVVEVPAEEVDKYVQKGGMNDLVVEAHSQALRGLGVDDEVVADASDVVAERFESRLSDLAGIEVVAEHGADENHACVAAASIVAKVERDRHVEEFGAGSGYPGDSNTRDFLERYVRRNGCLPPYARSSWQTSHDILSEFEQTALDEY